MSAMMRAVEIWGPVMLVAPPSEGSRGQEAAVASFPDPVGKPNVQFCFDVNQLVQDLHHDFALLASMVSAPGRTGVSGMVSG